MSEQLGPIDTSVKMPAAVARAAARSEEIFAAMKGQQPVTPEGNPAPAPEPTPPAPADVTITPDASAAAPAEPPAPTSPAPAPLDDDTWEAKYKAMHGRWKRAQTDLNNMSEQIQNLQNVIATMQAPPAAPPPELRAEKLLTPEEIKDYGEDLINVVGKKAKEEILPLLKPYIDKISELENKLQGVQAETSRSSREKLFDTLDKKLPQWRELNNDEKFLDWLALPDAYSGAIRQEMLNAAYTRGDATRVLAFFNGFLAEEAAVAPAPAGSDEGNTQRVPKVPLQNLAAPGRAKTAAAPSAPAEKPIFTRANIAAFYADVAAGKYRGRDADKNKLEAEIFAAQREGRIR